MLVLKQSNCYILSGGKSRRMGKDKALLKINNVTFLDHLISVYKPFFNQTIVVSSNQNHDINDTIRINDKIENLGPLGGIYSALKHNNMPNLFVSAIDLPLINSKIVSTFLNSLDFQKINVAKINFSSYPLFFHSPSKLLMELVNNQLNKNDYKLHNLFIKKYINEIEMSNFATEFSNINSDKDYQNII